MRENSHYIAELIGKYLDNSLTAEEQQALTEWTNDSETNRALFAEMTDERQLTARLQQLYAYDSDRIIRKISAAVPEFAAPQVVPMRSYGSLKKWGWAAAAAVILLAGGTYFWSTHQQNRGRELAVHQADIKPGTQGAVLTLADGSQLILDSMNTGVIASQKGASVILASGELIYDPTASKNSELDYNTMTTPKGRQFQVTLPDGTRAWLNAASSIRYPTTFAANERRVEVTGEVYFEVAKNVNSPFFVTVGNKAAIEVLGTSFNVNAYTNEAAIRTTLADGSVRVIALPGGKGSSLVLKPGQQAAISGQQLTLASKADLEKVMAWKNGLFNFDGASLEEVMRQLERWYDIEVVYENGIPQTRFIGEMSRQIALTDLLEILKRTEVDFRVEGRQLIVLNK
ncbi:FecR family protein [Chitinophaga jiangningensis]|uniref:FecR family protein n=1 Tax=Chitinophaga jiangningensis TaxID=1419482 RepID=A0A1M7IX09_9BACT|nr:FecR family protein [Chitinophaga jiangningensis]SHM45271.1 FecR family protein [Chitinophaga jiangningensis]